MPPAGRKQRAAGPDQAGGEASAWLLGVLDALPAALAVLDSGGRLIHLNARARQLTGYAGQDPADLEQCLRLAFPDPAYQDWLRGQWRQALAHGQYSLQAMVTCSDGGVRHLRINKSGLPGGLVLIWTLDAADLLEESPAAETPPDGRLASAFAETSLALVVSDIQSGQLLEVNQAFLDLTGHRAEEVLGRTSLELGLWPDPDFRRQMVALVAAQGGMHGLPLEIRRKDGQVIYALCSAEVVPRQGRRCLLATFIELSQHHLVTRALRESEQKFRTLTETAASGIFIIRGERIRYINPAGERICGYSLTELQRMAFWELVHPDHRELVRNRGLARQRGEPVPTHYEFKLLRPDGEERWVDFTAGTLTYQGQPAMLGTVYDITERKLAQEALRQSEERLRGLTENAPDIIFSLDRRGCFTYVNPAWERILGHRRHEVLGRQFVDLARPEDRDEYIRIFRLVRDQGQTVREHHGFMPLLGGGKRHFLMSGSPNLDSRGQVTGLVGLLKDVTQQEELEAQLRHAQKLEALGSLTGGVAHEFNNVLMTIRGYTQLLSLAQGDPARTGELLAKIDQGCQRAADLTRKMLTFSRIEAGEKQLLHLNQVVEGVWQFMRQAAPPAIELKLNLAPDLPPIVGNASQLEQVLMNLAINARDAIHGGGQVSFSTRLVDLGRGPDANPWLGGGSFVQAEVADSGAGMPPEVMQRIFDPFFTTKEPGKGTGLGLAVVYSILKSHGGHIWVESDQGKGSRFSIYLPVAQANPAAETAAEVRGHRPEGRGERVLVVDDEEHIRDIVREMLEAFGYQADTAANGLLALEMCADAFQKGRPYALVIMDLAMPVMDGAECMGRLHQCQPGVKVLVATGHGGEQAGISLQKHEPNGVLFKPYDISQLLGHVRRVLDGR